MNQGTMGAIKKLCTNKNRNIKEIATYEREVESKGLAQNNNSSSCGGILKNS